MRVAELMTRRVVSVEPDDALVQVKRILDNAPFHHLVVLRHGRLVGVISDRDLLAAISPYADHPAETARDLATLNKRAHQIMSRNPRTVRAEATLEEAIAVLLEGPGGCLPVVDAHEQPTGIITWRDLLRGINARNAEARGA